MSATRKLGIIDIGSNSIRLVIYELTDEKAYRVLDESKAAARLSGKITPDGRLDARHIQDIVDILRRFQLLCAAQGASFVRAVATAAIRNAANRAEIIRELEAKTGLRIEVLSGEEEARAGFLGMINSMNVRDGFLIDIGGGSTEVSLFLNRRLVHSVSLPYGSVNTAKRFSKNGVMTDADVVRLRQTLTRALEEFPWIRSHAGLPLVGVGGTLRSVGKIHQRLRRYSFPLAHNYDIDADSMNQLLAWLSSLPVEKRKKVDGLSSDRADIIVPGIMILTTVFLLTESEFYRIGGSGLRDGLFFETAFPQAPVVEDVLDHSISNLLSLLPSANPAHLKQVEKLSLRLFDCIGGCFSLPAEQRIYLRTAALLYRTGIRVQYYDYRQHSFYLIAHSRLSGLTHREMLMCALIASFKSKNRLRQLAQPYRDLLNEADMEACTRLGTLLNAAIALDRSETQPTELLAARIHKSELEIRCFFRHHADIEKRQFSEIQKDFKKVWGILPVLKEDASSS